MTLPNQEVTHDMLDQNIFEDFKDSYGSDIFTGGNGSGDFTQKMKNISENLFVSGSGETPKVQGGVLEVQRDLFVVSVKPVKPLVQQNGVFMVKVGAAKLEIGKIGGKIAREKLGEVENSEVCVSVELDPPQMKPEEIIEIEAKENEVGG